jgi:hypothetical protein
VTSEAGGRLRLAGPIGCEASQVLIQEFREVLLDLVDIDAAGAQDGDGIGIVHQAEQQMLQGGVFMFAIGRERQRPVQCLFEIPG